MISEQFLIYSSASAYAGLKYWISCDFEGGSD